MGSDRRNGRRAPWLIFWLVWPFRWPGDRRDRGRTDWRKRSHEGGPGRLGNIHWRSCGGDRKAICRPDHDRDFSDERAVAAVETAISGGRWFVLPLRTVAATGKDRKSVV